MCIQVTGYKAVAIYVRLKGKEYQCVIREYLYEVWMVLN